MLDDNNKIRNDLFDSIKGLSDEKLNQRPHENSWSIMQILEHLYLMESGIVAGMKHALKSDDNPAPLRPIHLTTNRSQQVIAPPSFVPSQNKFSLTEIKEKLNQSHSSLSDFVSNVDASQLHKKSFVHPLFGLMNLSQWIPFIGLHEKRHIEQIEETKEKLELE